MKTLISTLKKALGRGALLVWAGIVSLVLSVATLGQDIPDSASSQLPRQPEPFSIEEPLGMPRNTYLDLNSHAIVKPAGESHPGTGFQWRFAIPQSLLYTGIMHVYDLWTQPGTRDTLNGHWLDNYLASVSSLRGWSDSDTFMAPYVAHTIEGSVFGFIERQNDPKYRKVQWAMAAITSLAFCVPWPIPGFGTLSGRLVPSAKRRLATSCYTPRLDS